MAAETGAPSSQVPCQPPLIGVCLCNETCFSKGHVIGTVYLPPPNPQSPTLTQFRKEISFSFSRTLGQCHFIFLTSHGWEIKEDLENVIKLSNILTEDGKVNIRMSYNRPRLGIILEGPPDVPIGFIFCELTSTVAELRNEISNQLPGLYSSLSMKQFCYLDHNSWPITHRQENGLSILEIATSHCIKIRSRNNSFSRKISVIEEGHEKPCYDAMPLSFLSEEDGRNGSLSPITEQPGGTSERCWTAADYTDTIAPMSDVDSFEILLSYVHTEAGKYALLLKTALEDMGFSVFLDIHCIEGGKDWQDVLNYAITNCSLFIPLITMQYGQTLWTNREIKLADVLGKLILPINFNKSWPPKCLAIQFATTQYIPGAEFLADTAEITQENFTNNDASKIASKISEQYKREEGATRFAFDSADVEVAVPTLITCKSTELLFDIEPVSTPSSAGLNVPIGVNFLRRRSAIKSYGSNLPENVPEQYRMSMLESREGKPLIVISCCQQQREFAGGLVVQLQSKDYEVWCSCDVNDQTEEEKSSLFQEKVNEAGVVICILSKQFAEDTFCEQQVYYCEQRKRIIPLIYEPIEMPNWMATLIGTSTFIDCKSQSYLTALLKRITTALNPNKAGDELRQVIRQTMEMATLCAELDQKLPKGDHVYISGSTKFFSKLGEAICKEIGCQLAQEDEMVLVTGGFYGVGDTVGRSFFDERKRLNKPHGVCHVVAVRDEQDKSTQTRQNPDHTFQEVPYGETLFLGSSVWQREMLTPRVIDCCILIEGGLGAAFEAQQFVWNGNRVIPVRVTGGAAGGSFNVPLSIMIRPPDVKESDWSLLGDKDASPSDIASAVVQIVKTVKSSESVVSGLRTRSGTGGMLGEIALSKLKRSNVLVKRRGSAPRGSIQDSDALKQTLKGVKRALTEKGSR